MSSPSSAGPRMSPSVRAGPSPTWAKRSPQSSVAGGLLEQHPRLPARAAHAECRYGARARAPSSSSSPSASARGGRSAMSLIDTMQPSAPWATSACGAAARNSFMAPHSSDSTWPKAIQRRRSSGSTVSIASRTEVNIDRWPVWNSRGSSSSRRNWLNVKPVGPDLGHERGEAVDPRADLVNLCGHGAFLSVS